MTHERAVTLSDVIGNNNPKTTTCKSRSHHLIAMEELASITMSAVYH